MKKTIELASLGSGFVNPLPLEAAIIRQDAVKPLCLEYRATASLDEHIVLKSLQYSFSVALQAVSLIQLQLVKNTLYVVIDVDYSHMISDTLDQESLRQMSQVAKPPVESNIFQ